MAAARVSAPVNGLVADTGTPPIPEAQAWMARYGGAFGPLINMSQAVPGYPPHPAFTERLTAAAGELETSQYGLITGDAALREVYARHLSGLYGAAIDAADIAITAGCNLAYFAAAMLVAKAGDAVLLTSPWYFNHRMTLDMFGVEPRALPCDPARGFVPDAADAERLIDDRAKAIVLVTPNNPTGAVYPNETLLAFKDLCRAVAHPRRDLSRFSPPSAERKGVRPVLHHQACGARHGSRALSGLRVRAPIGRHIKIYSEPGQGTTVKVYLPRFVGAVEAVIPPTARRSPSSA